jgi:hypothetical protein
VERILINLLKVTPQGSKDTKLWYGYMVATVVYLAGQVVSVDNKPEMFITSKEQLGSCGKLD